MHDSLGFADLTPGLAASATPFPAGKGEGGIGPTGAGLGLLLCLLLFLVAAGAPAAETGAAPKILLLLASGLTLDDAQRLPHLRELARQGGVGLLYVGAAGTPTEPAAFLGIGAGERLRTPDLDAATAIFPSDVLALEHDSARAVYRRRFGAWPPPGAALLHLGLPAVIAAQPSPTQASLVGALGEALRGAGRRVAAYGGLDAALVLMDRRGIVPQGSLDGVATKPLTALLDGADVVAIAARDAAELDARAADAMPGVRSGRLHVLVAAIPPAPAPRAIRWERQGWIVAAGPGIAAKTVLTSPTTRTTGLVTHLDIAPTVLAWSGVAVPAGMTGRPFSGVAILDPWATVARQDRQATVTTRAIVPVLVGYGVFAIGAGLFALLVLLRDARHGLPLARSCLLAAAAALLAFLPVGLWAPTSVLVYGAAVALTSLLLAGLAALLGRVLGAPPLAILLTGTALVIVGDAVAGTPLVSRALLSGYMLSGIRFYGTGNEYMGLTIGAALLGPLLLRDTRKAMPGAETTLLWAAVLVAIGMPMWGANAGGALTAAVTFTTAFLALRAGRLRLRHVAAALAVAFLCLATFALVDRARPAAMRSHVGAALASGQARGGNALVEIAGRKAAMALAITRTPGTLLALAGLGAIGWLIFRGPFASRTRAMLAARPALGRALPAAAIGGLAALLFNDSGLAAGLLLIAPPTGAVVDGLLADAASRS